ncbi:hypothetical protein OG596_23745 [Streptomyces sp. NBC_01102]|uniref:hypothetical protein n=1 Tax=unclassified Streptomyces TaxID=2593676 RepID=UPI003869E7A1|nr:hypothetical protein OG596_23745 [Streptomyces sp. NBC_01102]
MRLRHTVVAALGALALVGTLPTAASAASGQFRYTYGTDEGYEAVGFLSDPPSGVCVNLPGAGSDELPPAYAPKNLTDASATVFLSADCEGDIYYTLRPGGGASDRLKVRSVVFS